MSDAMTSREIEDVLSSIRRLVSEDLRPPPRAAAPFAIPDPEPEKLILTPALRVVPPEDDGEDPRSTVSAPLPAWDGPGPLADAPDSRASGPVEAADLSVEADPAPDGTVMDEGPLPGVPADTAELRAEPAAEDDEPDMAARRTDRHPFASTRATAQDPFADDDLIDPAEAFVSPEALRDLVRDLLRDELRGALGERITGNIRKLVRAEIARALAAQALD